MVASSWRPPIRTRPHHGCAGFPGGWRRCDKSYRPSPSKASANNRTASSTNMGLAALKLCKGLLILALHHRQVSVGTARRMASAGIFGHIWPCVSSSNGKPAQQTAANEVPVAPRGAGMFAQL